VLKPGQFVRVTLAGAVRNNALTVPQTAVLDGVQGKFVYVTDRDKDGNDVAAARPVTLGDWVTIGGTNMWIVETGLKAGDKVIVDGLTKLHPGAPIKLASGAPPAAVGGGAPAAPALDAAKPAAAPKS
jgi:membrane fusion protein (multidrug efflux system)